MAEISTSRIIEVRDAIIAEINALHASRFQVSKDYADEYSLPNMKDVRVNLKIIGYTTEALDRGPSSEDRYQFELSVQQACNPDDADRLDTLVNLTMALSKLYYPNKYVAGLTLVPNTDNEPEIYNLICLRDHKHFHARINLTFRENVSD